MKNVSSRKQEQSHFYARFATWNSWEHYNISFEFWKSKFYLKNEKKYEQS